jgi:3-isopropylmalate/(R)-2-methylmalate dehydratase small subunit
MSSQMIKGNAWVFPGENYDVDVHLVPQPSRRWMTGKPKSEWAQYCMVPLDPEFPTKVQRGDIIVTGQNLGYGHDHIGPHLAMLACGIGAVVGESINMMFERNAINLGLPPIQFPGILGKVKTGDQLEISLRAGTIRNVTSGETLTFKPLPDFLLDIVEAGGLMGQVRQLIKEGKIKLLK